MPGFNEIDTVRTPQGAYVGQSSPQRSSESVPRPPRSIASIVPIPLIMVALLLVVYGLVIVWSAIQGDSDYSFSRQLLGVALGVIAMLIMYRIDYRRLADYTTALLIVNVVLILSPHLPVIGVTNMGATSWIDIGVQIQPGEFAKVTVILLDASVMARYGGKLDNPREYIKALVYIAIPFFCILTQPDLGTGLVYLVIGAVLLVMGGARLRYLIITLIACVVAIIGVFLVDELIKQVTGSYMLLKEYQRNRLLVFLDPSSDTSDSGYNLQQAMIAIGSGGVFGKGFGNATQSSLGFLPEAPTDFIFCVLAEQFGFVGALVLLGLYLALILLCCRIARNASIAFGTLIVCGVVGMWLFQIMENIGMDVGLMPITGIPLPFMSYGSSFMVVNFALLGLVCSVHAHK